MQTLLSLSPRNQAVVVLVGIVVLLTILEMLFSYIENRKYYKRRDTFNTFYLTTVTFFVNLAFKGATFFILSYFYQFRLFEIRNAIIYWIVLVVTQDFLYWLLHYIGHYCRLFWAMHVTHHSSEEFNFSTGFRSTVFEPLYRVFFYIPLALMGFNALDILYAYLLTQMYGNLVHTQIDVKLPKWYGWLFVTPSHHRVHHASNIPYLDKNMGMVFIIWDRLFGTFQEENVKETTHYGLTKQPEDMGPVNIIFHEWRALWHDVREAPTLRAKLGYIFMPPGWSHDGHTQTARVLQKEYWETHS
ncbi:MAG: sterol desaturase family protein [Mucilaginibacter polytrichastri]|nr:sterol desaturase family protein [Mucilaginibacter polytrichastri]